MAVPASRGPAGNARCPWSGDPVSDDALTLYRGRVVGFCNPGCRDKFDKAVALFEAADPVREDEHG